MKSKYLFNFILIGLIVYSCSSTELIPKSRLEKYHYEEVKGYKGVEDEYELNQYPMYPYGRPGIVRDLAKNAKFQKDQFGRLIYGSATVEFIVNEYGKVSKAKVIQGRSNPINREAIRVINSLQRFYPGMKDGEPVRVKYQQDVVFGI